ncbi:hypothetical protein J1N35_005055 [Gossypium stocksii]|uniref:DUF4283 domain-containing protein n=1 Tax=Gossypium stocksii TaxID=47602 RepID=A0A9D4AIW8_9ROSI|nr:hypothetical protein J1N35_005055 [Gossypium stocksii]
MDHENCDEGKLANRSTKKVRIRVTEGVPDVIMDPVRATGNPLSWKDCLPGTGLRADYLTVRPWIKDFSTSQSYPSMVMAWIRLPGLLGHMYKRRILLEIGGTIGKVAKLDFNTDAGFWGRFARLAVYVNLEKPLISQLMAKRNRGEGDVIGKSEQRPKPNSYRDEPVAKSSTYGPWMSVERKETLVVEEGDQEEHFGLKAKPGYKGNRPVVLAPTKEVDPSLMGPKQQKEGGGNIVIKGQGPYGPTEGDRPGANAGQLKLGSAKLVIEKAVGVSNVGLGINGLLRIIL